MYCYSELLEISWENHPSEFEKLSSLAIAVNSEYADDNAVLQHTDEIAIIPPVSGG